MLPLAGWPVCSGMSGRNKTDSVAVMVRKMKVVVLLSKTSAAWVLVPAAKQHSQTYCKEFGNPPKS